MCNFSVFLVTGKSFSYRKSCCFLRFRVPRIVIGKIKIQVKTKGIIMFFFFSIRNSLKPLYSFFMV